MYGKTCRGHHTPAVGVRGRGGGHHGSENQSPFANSAQGSGRSSQSPSPTPSDLPSGVRYIRATPTSIYRPVTHRSATVAKRRDPSPGKNLRFAEPLVNGKTDTKCRSSERIDRPCRSRQQLNRPVIKPVDATDSHKPVAKSSATGQSSPIFASGVDFGGDTQRTTTSAPKRTHSCCRSKSASRESTPESGTTSSSPTEPKTVVKTAINVPNKTVHKSTVLTPNDGYNVHRNRVSIPLQAMDRNGDPNRLSVNVNVAVGLQCDDDKVKNSMAKKAYEKLSKHLTTISDDSGSDLSDMIRHDTSDEMDYFAVQSPESGSAIQVAVRLRPFLKAEHLEDSVIEMSGNTVRVVNAENENYNRLEFGFDSCLNSSDRDLFDFAAQDHVYQEMGRPLLERALEGYNVCLFAYGQTGSGKSFTMTGTDTNAGVIPRFVRELFKRFLTLVDIVFTVEVSYCEIYNEKIYDLLSDDKVKDKKTLRIREHPQSGPYVEHLSQHLAENVTEVMDLLQKGTKRRATASTAMNDTSSRSHSIFTIVLSQLRSHTEMGLDVSFSCGSRINLIDLAGSERVGIAGTSGDRLKEGSLINKSLLNLGKVIKKLADLGSHRHKVAHIPYRDSQLTYLLKDSLGGNSRTSMIATISPAKCHLEETLSTLRYAATARSIVNYVHINEDPKNRKIRELMEEIAFLRTQHMEQQLIPHTCDKRSDDSIESNEYIEPKAVQMLSIGTNTSFVEKRRMSTKMTDTSFSDFPDTMSKTKTCSIATNTSFVKSKMCSIGTDAVPPVVTHKPITKSTATEMSFSETSSRATFIDMPTREDLWRGNKLGDKQRKLLAEIRKYRDKLMGVDASGEESEQYFDANPGVDVDVVKTEPPEEVGWDEVDNRKDEEEPAADEQTNGYENNQKENNEEGVNWGEDDGDWYPEGAANEAKDDKTEGQWDDAVGNGDNGDERLDETTKKDKKSDKKDKKSDKKGKKSDKKRESNESNKSNKSDKTHKKPDDSEFDWGDDQNNTTVIDSKKKDGDHKKVDNKGDTGGDNWGTDTGADNKHTDNGNTGDDWGTGADDKGTGGDDWGTGADGKGTGGDDWDTGADDKGTGGDDNNWDDTGDNGNDWGAGNNGDNNTGADDNWD